MTTDYESDIVAWASEQAWMLRNKKFELLDLDHIAEEIEDVGKSEQRELASRMAVLLGHLLKWHWQPERRGASWEATLKTQRQRIERRLKQTPSLGKCLNDPDWWADAWDDARDAVEKETGISYDKFPEHCPWAVLNILCETWFPPDQYPSPNRTRYRK